MNKKRLLILGMFAVVAILLTFTGCRSLFSGNNEEVSTTATTTEPQTEYDFNNAPLEDVSSLTEEFVTDENGNIITTLAADASTQKNNSNTTTKKNTSSSTKKDSTTTTKKSTGSTSYPGDDKLVDQLIGPNGQQFLGYRYNPDGDYYYTDDKDCWQSNAGYNEYYDNLAGLAMMPIDQIRIRFTYDHKDWMIQLWKGQYGTLLIGTEIGVYTAEEGSYKGETGDVNHYNCAAKEDWLKMEMTCYWSENNSGTYKKAFHREYDYYWWATGFVKGQLTKYTAPRTEIKLKARITFKSEEMASLFVKGLKESGFSRASSANTLVSDSYYQNGADVSLLWLTKYHDAFVGYGE